MTKQQEQIEEVLLDEDQEIQYEDNQVESDEQELDSVEEDVDESEDLEEADTQNNGTEAAATLRPNSKPADPMPKLKSAQMSQLMSQVGKMAGQDWLRFFELAMGAAKEFTEKIPDGAAARNRASVAAKGKPTTGETIRKAVKEDLTTVFGGDDSEELSEELKEKMTTIFEAALDTRLQMETVRLEEEFEEKLESEVEAIAEELAEGVDKYLSYAAETWLEENELAVQQSLKTELAESFITDLDTLCKEYRINLPEGEDDVIETLVDRVEKLEGALNESESDKMELAEAVNELHKEMIIEKMADELSPIHYNKFKSLAESVEYDDEDEKYVQKLEYIRESFFSENSAKTTPPSSQLINEDIAENAEDEAEKQIFVDPAVRAIHDAISRTVTKR